jgi:hypothetical protein
LGGSRVLSCTVHPLEGFPRSALKGRLWGDGYETETPIRTCVAKHRFGSPKFRAWSISRFAGVSDLYALNDGLRMLADCLLVAEGNNAGTANDLSWLKISPGPTCRRADQ